jgi:oxygen-independent coproporphyrinogen-3 oxidase
LKYWLREPYLGVGADAHSFNGTERIQNVEQAADYVDRVAGGESPVSEVSEADPVGEPFFLGLRLDRGIKDKWSPFEAAIRKHVENGLLETNAEHLRLTARGVLLSNEVFADFVGDRVDEERANEVLAGGISNR